MATLVLFITVGITSVWHSDKGSVNIWWTNQSVPPTEMEDLKPDAYLSKYFREDLHLEGNQQKKVCVYDFYQFSEGEDGGELLVCIWSGKGNQ